MLGMVAVGMAMTVMKEHLPRRHAAALVATARVFFFLPFLKTIFKTLIIDGEMRIEHFHATVPLPPPQMVLFYSLQKLCPPTTILVSPHLCHH